MVAGLRRAFVGLQERLVQDHHDRLRGERGQVEDLDVERALLALWGITALKLTCDSLSMHADVHGDHPRLRTENAAKGRVAVFGEGADGGAGIDDLEGVQGRGQRRDHLGGGHGQRDRAGLQQRMPAGQQLLAIHVSHRASGGDLNVAAHQ